MKSVGIALGGGGAKGLAHVTMLQVLEELGVTPTMIAGTSIGAIVGALYAAGVRSSDMAEGIQELTAVPTSLREAIQAKQLFGWLDYIGLEVGRNSLLQVDKFLLDMERVMGVSDFGELQIPLQVVAADFWARRQVVFHEGPIIPAVSASFALPGLFKPVVINGRVLIDGGCVNPVPYDLLLGHCDIVIAVDVTGRRAPDGELLPSYVETIFNTFQIASTAILNEKRRIAPPAIFIQPDIKDVRVLDFHKFDRITDQATDAAAQLKRELAIALGE